MSRVGKKPVAVPAGVTAKVDGQIVAMKGGKGELNFTAPKRCRSSSKTATIVVTPLSEDKRARAMWGTTRARVQNLVIGVTKGFEKKLEINGVGYKAAVAGKNLQLSLGYSHDVDLSDPGRASRSRRRSRRRSPSPASTSSRSARSRRRSAISAAPSPTRARA